MGKKNNGGGFLCSQLDIFAPSESLKIENRKRHGSCCGVILTLALVAVMLAYAANELLIGGSIKAFRIHAHTSIVTDYDGSDQELKLVNEKSALIFGLYDTTLKKFVSEEPRYFTYQAMRKTLIAAETEALESTSLSLSPCEIKRDPALIVSSIVA